MTSTAGLARETGAGLPHVAIYTDGSAAPTNPGPGGYGVLLIRGRLRQEFFGGYRHTTNNRMELMAAIVALETLEEPSEVMLFSDSKYLVDSMEKGRARRWQARGWRCSKGPAKNADLWIRLLLLCLIHDVTFAWIRGHAGNRDNERCDELAERGRCKPDNPPDTGYENPDSEESRVTREGQPCPVCLTPVAVELRHRSKWKHKILSKPATLLYCVTCNVRYEVQSESRLAARP